MQRSIREIRTAHASRDGDGVAIQRVAGMKHAGMDPILMIDELRSDNREDFAGGFPPHPHRGMQTLTYMKTGGFRHEDSIGNKGEIRDGGAQWMSAGRGIIHSEMPLADTQDMHGFQIWINLLAVEKMSEPRYRDVAGEELVKAAGAGYVATAVSGCWQLGGTEIVGPLEELSSRAGIVDLSVEPRQSLETSLLESESAIAYIYRGSLVVDGKCLEPQNLLVSGPGDRWRLQAGENGTGVLLLKGEPLKEPVVNYGPFVMNTMEQIEQAIQDYQSGQFV